MLRPEPLDERLPPIELRRELAEMITPIMGLTSQYVLGTFLPTTEGPVAYANSQTESRIPSLTPQSHRAFPSLPRSNVSPIWRFPAVARIPLAD